jgi:hypothetical protein
LVDLASRTALQFGGAISSDSELLFNLQIEFVLKHLELFIGGRKLSAQLSDTLGAGHLGCGIDCIQPVDDRFQSLLVIQRFHPISEGSERLRQIGPDQSRCLSCEPFKSCAHVIRQIDELAFNRIDVTQAFAERDDEGSNC